jgi:crossover junction endodeoxyribonuclease RuvC
MNLEKETVILGIDPGTVVMGYGVIRIVHKKMELLTMGVIRLHTYENHALKLKTIFEKTVLLIDQWNPDELAIEAPFYGKNVQSMLKLGRAQGVAIAAALHRGLPMAEYAPKKIKQSITGNGNASKEQVAGMLQSLFKIEVQPKFHDATDGLAAAVCHHFQQGNSTSGTSYSGWKSFVSRNPGRSKT